MKVKASHLGMSKAKRVAAEAVMPLIHTGCRIALGTGSTMEACLPGLARIPGIVATPTSPAIAERAREAGITMVPVCSEYDLYIDGADQVASSGDVIKGSWGAHVREKCLAALARERILVCEGSKMVSHLTGPVPVAVVPYFAGLYCDRNDFTLDVNGLAIIGFHSGRVIEDPRRWNDEVMALPGVVSTGLFTADFVHRIVIGHEDGSVRMMASVACAEN
jgi:ribose 5-phosphate isomerase A